MFKNRCCILFYSLSFIFLCFLTSCKDKNSTPHETLVFSADPLIDEILTRIKSDFINTPDESKMKECAINGMLSALGPYCVYMPPETYTLFTDSTHGEFGGIGLEILFHDGLLRVVSPIDDSPAAKAGIQSGDFITHVDDISVSTLSYSDLFNKLHGKPGTSLTLTIQRGTQDPLPIKIDRAVIELNPVKYKIHKNIAYIRLSYFNEKTVEKMKNAITSLKKEAPSSLKGVILDLRNNPGGLLDQSVAITSLFLDHGDVVHIKGKDPATNRTYSVNGTDQFKGLPIIVLINHGSASAAEIVAGALQENKRALILGKKSVGKGSVQGLFSLSENRGGLKLTIHRFLTPSGKEIQGIGITPDIEVDQPPRSIKSFVSSRDLISEDDYQLIQAFDILKSLEFLKK